MGSLAFWSGVAGGAKGWQDNIARRVEDRRREEDYGREEALIRLRGDLEDKRQQRGFEHTERMAAQRQEFEAAQAETERDWRSEEAGLDRAHSTATQEAGFEQETSERVAHEEWLSNENELDRQLKERLDQLAISTGRNDPQLNRHWDRYERSTLSVGEEIGNTGFKVETETAAIYDRMGGGWYVQEGDKLYQPGDPDKGVRYTTNEQGQRGFYEPSEEALQQLYDDPTLEEAFLNEYGYLPVSFLARKQEFGIQEYLASRPGIGGTFRATTRTSEYRDDNADEAGE